MAAQSSNGGDSNNRIFLTDTSVTSLTSGELTKNVPEKFRTIVSEAEGKITDFTNADDESKRCSGHTRKMTKSVLPNTMSSRDGIVVDVLCDHCQAGISYSKTKDCECVLLRYHVEDPSTSVPLNSAGGGSGQNEATAADIKVEESNPGSSDKMDVKEQLQHLFHVLETSQDPKEKKRAMEEIDRWAEANKDIISIELDESDCYESDGAMSTVSSEPFHDIPLPDQPIAKITITGHDADFLTGIPLPGSSSGSTMFFDEDSLEVPPLPPLPPTAARAVGGIGRQQKCGKDAGNKKSKSEKTLGELNGGSEEMEERGLQTNTSLGPVTLHVNKKLVPRLNKSSVFDLNEENAKKEIGRHLLRLKRLKKLRKIEEAAEHKIEAKDRISMWKEELLVDSGASVISGDVVATAKVAFPQQERNSEETTNEIVALNLLSGNKSLCMLKTDNLNDKKETTDGFIKVRSKDDKKEYSWPVVMVQSTKCLPKLCFSCNPLEFDFGVAGEQKRSGKSMEDEGKEWKKNKSQETSSRKKKKYHRSSSRDLPKKDEQLKLNKEIVQQSGTSSNANLGGGYKKQPDESNSSISDLFRKVKDGVKECYKGKSEHIYEKKKIKKTESKVHNTLASKGKHPDIKDSKKCHGKKENLKNEIGCHAKDKQMENDNRKFKDSSAEKHSSKDGSRKRKLSVEDEKQLMKKVNLESVSKSVEIAQRLVAGKMSDFDDFVEAESDTGRCKWDTSSDSEVEMASKNRITENRNTASHKKDDRGRRRSRSSSRRGSSSSHESHSDSETGSRVYHTCSRSYSSSYYSSDRSRSYSSSSDYRHRHSRSSSRSRSHRRRSSSYSDSYRSKSRSYTRSRRSRTRSCSRYRYSSYSSYSHSSRSVSRSRSKSRLRRRYGRSSNRDTYYRRRSQWKENSSGVVHSKTLKQEPRQELKPKSHVNDTKSNEEMQSDAVKQPVPTASLPKKDGTSATVCEKASDTASSAGETSATKMAENSTIAVTDEGKDFKFSEIPRPVEDTSLSIPLPPSSLQKIDKQSRSGSSTSVTGSASSFIGPTLPENHPLAHIQDIPVPKNEQFQPIGPDDPLVFKTPLLPPPPPPSFLTDSPKHMSRNPPLPPKPTSPPPLPNDWSTMEDIAGDEEPIPQMLDMGAIKPAMIIPPEQAEQYKALQHQAQLHARQRLRQEAGIVDEDEEDESVLNEAQQQQQLLEEMLLEQVQNAAFLAPQPVMLPQPQLIAPRLGSSPAPQVVVCGPGFFQVPMSVQVVSTGHRHGLVTLAPSVMPMLPQAGAPVVFAAQTSGAMSALMRVHEAQAQAQAEADEEAEAQAKAQVQASVLQGQPREWVQIMHMPGSGHAVAVPAQAMSPSVAPHAITLAGLRSAAATAAGIPLQHGVIPFHAVNHPALQHSPSLFQSFPFGFPVRLGLSSGVVGAHQMLASSAQPQAMPLLIDQTGNVLVPRLLRYGHL